MPIATMKKNDPNCPINFNDPSGERRREGQPLPCKQTSDGSAYLERRRPILQEHSRGMDGVNCVSVLHKDGEF
jgi:hypothetical protein